MSFRFRFQVQPEGGLVIAVFEGEMGLSSERQALEALCREPGVDLGADLLVDRRRAVSVTRAEDFDRRLEQARETFPAAAARRPRMAVIVANDVEFGLGRMFEQRGGDEMPHEIRVVRSVDEACEWLGVRPDALVWPPD